MLIKANVEPHITGKFSRYPLNSEVLKGWESKLADFLPTDSEHASVESLIDSDYYFDLLLPRKMEFRDGLKSFQPKRGWILEG